MRAMAERECITENNTLTEKCMNVFDYKLKTAADLDASKESEHYWKRRSVYRLPPQVTDLNTKAYSPQTVSIGPYHCGKDHLKAMEKHKLRALHQILNRSRKPLDLYVKALVPVVEDLKQAYDQLDEFWQQRSDEFLVRIIMDGCFVLEVMRTASGSSDNLITAGSSDGDPIFSYHGKVNVVPHLRRDMLLLENQLPMLLLVTLFGVENDMPMIHGAIEQHKAIILLILKFLSHEPLHEIDQFGKCLHILDVHQKSLLLESPHQKIKKNIVQRRIYHGDKYDFIPSATELSQAGIRIRRSKTRSLTDISFDNGVLELPLIVVDGAFESEYLNLMAFERFHVGAGSEVTSYIYFMSCLIGSAGDVRRLQDNGVVYNELGSDESVADLLNSLRNDSKLDPDSRLNQVKNQVVAYYLRLWNRWRAEMIRKFSSTPEFTMISIVTFYLTVVQTVYTVASYRSK